MPGPSRTLAWLALAAAVVFVLLQAQLRWSAREGGLGIERPNILLISIDTVRADHLGAYGYARETSATLDSLAREGVLYEHAISQAPWTLPSVASMLTGLYPSEHGAVSAETRLPDGIETLAEALGRDGYHTVGITSHSFIDRRHGLAQGFDLFDESQIAGHEAVTSEPLTRLASEALAAAPAGRPFFVWVHYFDPHFTYVRHPEFHFADGYDGPLQAPLMARYLNLRVKELDREGKSYTPEDLRYVKAVFDEEIAYTDRWIGRLLARLRDLELDRSTVVVLTADHGEYFLDRGRFFHGKDVYEPLVRVPLVVAGAIPRELRGARVRVPVEVSSIPRTVLQLTGVENPSIPGTDLLALATGDPAPLPVFAEGSYAWGEDQRKETVVLEGFKLIHNLDDGRHELYDLRADPGERNDLWGSGDGPDAAFVARLKHHLDRFPTRPEPTPTPIEIGPEEIERLRALGYTQ